MMRLLPITLSLAGLAIAAAASAHDVSGSDVKVYIQDSSAEVWQSTPRAIAHGLIDETQSTAVQKTQMQEQRDELAMIEISKGWVISSDKNQPCSLVRQAHRPTHNEEYIQIRYLFTCPDAQRPAQLSMPWLDQTPKDHIITLHMDQGRGQRTYFIDRPNYTFPIRH